jgi:hypothetical protein
MEDELEIKIKGEPYYYKQYLKYKEKLEELENEMNPETYKKMMEIFREFFNYMHELDEAADRMQEAISIYRMELGYMINLQDDYLEDDKDDKK